MTLKGYGLVANMTLVVPVILMGYAGYNFYIMTGRSYNTKDKKYITNLINEVQSEKILNKKKQKNINKTILIRKSNPELEPDI